MAYFSIPNQHFIPYTPNSNQSFGFMLSISQFQFQRNMEILQRCYIEKLLWRQESLRQQYQQYIPTSQLQLKEESPLLIAETISETSNLIEQSPIIDLPICKENKKETKEIKKKLKTFIKIEEDFECSKSEMKTQVEKILNFFMKNFGKINKKEVAKQRSLYKGDELFFKLFDALADKYQSASKSREDMTRFVLRKAITHLRDVIRNEHKTTAKGASIILCKRYFNQRFDELLNEMAGEDPIGSYEKLLGFLLPYKKNSRNKTANMNFITEIFASEIFNQDYRTFLNNFDKIIQIDNENRTNKFCDFLVKCLQDGKVHKAKDFKRLPWLDFWIENSKEIASDLLNARDWRAIIENSPENLIEGNNIKKQLKQR